MRRYRALAVALLVQLVGAGAALLVSVQTWQRLTAAREGPFPDVRVDMTGRDVDSAITALALVALAGVVALLATRGPWRRAVGVVVALAGAGIVVRALLSAGAVGNGRALDFIASRRETVTTRPGTRVGIDVVAAWPVLTVACGLLVLAAGALVALRGGRWEGMSARYEVTPEPESAAETDAKAATSMWSALDRGEDPTAS